MHEIQQWPKSIPRHIVANCLFLHISIFFALTLLVRESGELSNTMPIMSFTTATAAITHGGTLRWSS